MRNKLLDQNRFIAAIFVVFLHIPFPGVFGDCLESVCRISVPFFFLISGFYSGSYKNMPQKIRKTSCLLVWGVALYFFWNILYAFINQRIEAICKTYFSIDCLIETFIFNNGLLLGHLWFLLALIYCYVFRYITKDRCSYKRQLFVAVALIVCHFCLREILEINAVNNSTMYIRNFWFVGLPYFLLGRVFCHNKERIKNIPKYLVIIIGILGVILTIVERLLWKPCEMYVGTVFFAISFFVYSLTESTRISVALSEYGKKYTGDIYIYHVIIISVVNIVANKLVTYQNNWILSVKPFIVIFLTLMFSKIKSKFKDALKGEKAI